MATSPSQTSTVLPVSSNTSMPPINPLDSDPQTPLQQPSTMPRAPPTPPISDPLFGGFTENLPVVSSAAAPQIPQPQPLLLSSPAPIAHPILSVQIQNYIKFTVNTAGDNFSKWRQIILWLLTMYKTLDHVTEGAAPRDPDDSWLAVDIHLSLWFMATLSDDLLRLVQGADGRAGSTWARITRFFLDRDASRYHFLSTAFRATPRGDMSVADYASKLQQIADDLAAIGRPLGDDDLTFQFLDGLGGKFTLQAEILKITKPLIAFSDAVSHLQRAEVNLDKQQLQAGAQALVVHGAARDGPSHTGGSVPGPCALSWNLKK